MHALKDTTVLLMTVPVSMHRWSLDWLIQTPLGRLMTILVFVIFVEVVIQKLYILVVMDKMHNGFVKNNQEKVSCNEHWRSY